MIPLYIYNIYYICITKRERREFRRVTWQQVPISKENRTAERSREHPGTRQTTANDEWDRIYLDNGQADSTTTTTPTVYILSLSLSVVKGDEERERVYRLIKKDVLLLHAGRDQTGTPKFGRRLYIDYIYTVLYCGITWSVTPSSPKTCTSTTSRLYSAPNRRFSRSERQTEREREGDDDIYIYIYIKKKKEREPNRERERDRWSRWSPATHSRVRWTRTHTWRYMCIRERIVPTLLYIYIYTTSCTPSSSIITMLHPQTQPLIYKYDNTAIHAGSSICSHPYIYL